MTHVFILMDCRAHFTDGGEQIVSIHTDRKTALARLVEAGKEHRVDIVKIDEAMEDRGEFNPYVTYEQALHSKQYSEEEVFSTVSDAMDRITNELKKGTIPNSATISIRGEYSIILYLLDQNDLKKLLDDPKYAEVYTEE